MRGRMGTAGTSGLGWRPFHFLTDVIRGHFGAGVLCQGFSYRTLACYEFVEESAAGIDWFSWLPYKQGPVEVLYRGKKTYTVWVIAPEEFWDEAATELLRWVQERDLETVEETSFAICLHEGFNEFQEAVAWWSLADATVITLREEMANEIFASLEAGRLRA